MKDRLQFGKELCPPEYPVSIFVLRKKRVFGAVQTESLLIEVDSLKCTASKKALLRLSLKWENVNGWGVEEDDTV